LWQVWQTVSVESHDCGETTWCRSARALSLAPQSPHWALSMDRTVPACWIGGTSVDEDFGSGWTWPIGPP
jgi:hypothetical protein